MKIYTQQHAFNADTYTPVGLYLSLRDRYRKVSILESNDYHSRQDSKSFIGLDPIVEILESDGEIVSEIGGRQVQRNELDRKNITEQVSALLNNFEFQTSSNNGFFGRLSFEFNAQEESRIRESKPNTIPLFHFLLYRYVIVIDHFTNEGLILENSFDNTFNNGILNELLAKRPSAEIPFELLGNERAEFSDVEFEKLVEKGIEHCKRGDVFQIVLSNAFEQKFIGDDFHVYRQLRRLNPSPYLFYFDFENYRLFGSSPEAQLQIKNGNVEIHSIAGTIPRTGIKAVDDEQLDFLLKDQKENAEHTMLVDLARNDLSKNCSSVKIEKYKEVQAFSHVIHLVSKVCGQLNSNAHFESLVNSFPAGTLSGTPKPRALELINQYERTSREFYGGAIGMFSPNEGLNMAIVIRSALSINSTLHYRAGAGVVLDSIPNRECQEVHHKLGAIRKAIELIQANLINEKQLV